ncbi:MAG: hypothetical protein GY812_10815 [Actinomycetia bacterium]|nr:hypothetical protein [Actinomycetes bacterium]
MTTASPRAREAGRGWIVFSGIMLLLLGIKLFLDGLWALDRSDTVVDAFYYNTDLGLWGWIYLLVGILVFLAGLAVFQRAQWARWTGVAAASVGLVSNFLWLYAYPIPAFIGVVLAALVLYGLVVYGDEELLG